MKDHVWVIKLWRRMRMGAWFGDNGSSSLRTSALGHPWSLDFPAPTFLVLTLTAGITGTIRWSRKAVVAEIAELSASSSIQHPVHSKEIEWRRQCHSGQEENIYKSIKLGTMLWHHFYSAADNRRKEWLDAGKRHWQRVRGIMSNTSHCYFLGEETQVLSYGLTL